MFKFKLTKNWKYYFDKASSMIINSSFGHPTKPGKNDWWRFIDTNEIVNYKNYHSRKCPKCNKYPTKEGHDPCIASLPGVSNACCGHGIRMGYVQFKDGSVIRGVFDDNKEVL